jgi:hypothetical protein
LSVITRTRRFQRSSISSQVIRRISRSVFGLIQFMPDSQTLFQSSWPYLRSGRAGSGVCVACGISIIADCSGRARLPGLPVSRFISAGLVGLPAGIRLLSQT